jgi:hypothetical protein
MKVTENSCDKLWYLLGYVIVLIAQAVQRDMGELNKQHVSKFFVPTTMLKEIQKFML